MQTSSLKPNNEVKSQTDLFGKILELEAAMLAMPEKLIHIEPKHYFVPGIYMREIFIPKGTTLTGHIHKTEHMCVLSLGDVSVITGDGIKRVQASTVIHSSPGVKRVLHAHEDSVWINVHHNPSNERDLEKIEEIFVAKTFDEFLDFERDLKQIQGGK